MNAPHFVSIAVAICAISVYGQVPPAELGRPQPVPAISPEETPATRPERTAETPQTPRPRGEAKKLLSYKDLAGATVKNNFGQKLGSVENVVIDVHQGRVSLAILSVGEVLRIGGKQVPVPFTALSLTGV
jgi:sporulation protein YlmC with PRC-barrel domain